MRVVLIVTLPETLPKRQRRNALIALEELP